MMTCMMMAAVEVLMDKPLHIWDLPCQRGRGCQYARPPFLLFRESRPWTVQLLPVFQFRELSCMVICMSGFRGTVCATCAMHLPVSQLLQCIPCTSSRAWRDQGGCLGCREWVEAQIKSSETCNVAVMYASAYGNTASLAQAISRGITKAGEQPYTLASVPKQQKTVLAAERLLAMVKSADATMRTDLYL